MAMSNLTQRILSAIVLAPLAIAAVYAGGLFFNAFVLLLFVCSTYEWFEMSKTFRPRLAYLLAGILYFSVSLFLLSDLRSQENGLMLTVYVLVIVWVSDTCAYLAGRGIGGPKLAPAISPNKTWAGLVGAIFGTSFVLFSFIENAHVRFEWHLLLVTLGAVVLGVVAQAGDFLESYMKRKAGIKDSGKLIPGHGGVLDRIDALLLVIPFFYAICHFTLL